jgi:hypothetical protein
VRKFIAYLFDRGKEFRQDLSPAWNSILIRLKLDYAIVSIKYLRSGIHKRLHYL